MKHVRTFLCLFILASSSAAAQQGRPLEVPVFAPNGEVRTIDQVDAIVASFNQPMTALKEVPTDDSEGPMVISPAIRGKYRWMGTATLTLRPSARLPFATGYSVTIPAGTKSLSGQALAQAVSWMFETPRPRVESISPYKNQRSVELDHAVQLKFNQPVDPAKCAAFLSIRQELAGTKATYPKFAVERPLNIKENADRCVLLRPAQPLAPEAQITVIVKAGLRGVEGPLPMSDEFSSGFRTYNIFKFVQVKNVDGFSPSSALRLEFSNPVLRNDVIAHLRFQPEIKPEEWEYDYPELIVDLSCPFEAEKIYDAVLLPGLKDQFGNVLKDTVRFSFRTGSLPPSVRLVTGQGVLEAYAAHKIPVTFTNVDTVTLQMGRIDPDRIVGVMQKLDYQYTERLMWEEAVLEWMDSRSEEPGQFNLTRLWMPGVPRNKRVIKPIDLDEVLGTSARGIVLVQVDNMFPKPRRRFLKTLVQVTDMGITSKFSPEQTLIWVTNLKNATAVGGAKVELRNDANIIVWTGTTDASGLAMAPGWGKLGLRTERKNHRGNGSEEEGEYDWGGGQQPRQWVIVRNKGDVAFSSSDWNSGIEPYVFNVGYEWSPKYEKTEGTLFTDRGLYKAGEQVEIKGIVRALMEGTWRIPRRVDVKFTVRDSRGEEVLSTRPTLNEFGSFAVSIPLRSSAPLGTYSMQLQSVKKVGSGANQTERTEYLSGGSFRVEAFRPAEFEVTALLHNKKAIIGDTISGQCTARYLFGAALKNAPVRWRLTASSSWSAPEGYDGYYFGPMTWLTRTGRGNYQQIVTKDTVLDGNGGVGIRFPLEVGSVTGPQLLTLEADVTSPTRQVISGRASVSVQGGTFAIGVSPSTTFTGVDSLVSYRIVAVNGDGKLVQKQKFDVRLYQRIWRSVRKAETGGRYHWESTIDNILKDSAAIVTGNEPISRSFRPKEAGLYFFDVAGQDERGNEIRTNAYFYASGPGYVAWERSDDDKIELIADKTNYRPGDVAHVIVKSPYEKAPALISIEREGIIQHYTTTLVGSAPQIDIPVRNEFLPNVFVSVVLLQGRVEGAAITREADVGRPSFKIGYVTLPVSPAEKQLKVEVQTDRKEYRPGDTVTVTLRTRMSDGHGASAEVALSVADLGVLNLIGYRMPDPFHLFYRERGLAVRTTESRIHLIQQRNYDEKGEEPGGGGMDMAEQSGLDAEGIRKDFRPSAYWNPSIVTDASGTAKVQFKLPDNLTAFQLMAVGQTTSSDFGYGETSIQVNKPLLLQPSLPRFVRKGDVFDAGVVVMNYSPQSKEIKLITKAEGIVFKGRDTVTLTLGPGKSQEVRHHLEAQKVGTAVFTFRATTGVETDGLQWKVPIQIARPSETVALSESMIAQRQREEVQIPKDIERDLGGLEFSASSTAMSGLTGGISYLFEYPYGCLEQRLSRLLPMIMAKDLVEAFKFEVFKGKDYRQVVTRMLDELPMFQRYDGGFSYWKNTDETWPYISAFAMYTLVKARQNGYTVSSRTMDEGMSYLQNVLAGNKSFNWYTDDAWGCTRALILYTLAVNGTPHHGYMEKLFKERDRISLFARAYLLKALVAAKGNPDMISSLVNELTFMAKVSPTSVHFEERKTTDGMWVFHSTTRTTALVMQALMEARPENALIPKVVRWLIDEQRKGCWRTTQENWYVVDALATYFRIYEKEVPEFQAEVQLAGGTALKQSFIGRSLEVTKKQVPMSDLQAGVSYPVDFLKKGPGRFYYGMRMQYYPKAAPTAKEEGLTISREVEGASRDAAGTIVLRAGTLTHVRVTISTPQDRHFVVLEDPIPAGFEIVQTSFATSASGLAGQESQEWWWTNPFRHRELNDDRALFFAEYLPAGVFTVTYTVRATGFGTFGVPPAHAEGMYEPEVFGQTNPGILRVE